MSFFAKKKIGSIAGSKKCISLHPRLRKESNSDVTLKLSEVL